MFMTAALRDDTVHVCYQVFESYGTPEPRGPVECVGILRENRSHEGSHLVSEITPGAYSSASELLARAYGAGRVSAPRLAIARAAERASGAFTVEELSVSVRRYDPGVSTATVYRSVAAMAASGYLTRVGERDGATLWARCGQAHHHHHLVCTSCGATAHTACPVDASALAAATPEGFTVTSHDVRLYGLCASCAGRPGGNEG
jgi:Fur family ferric uptake transcriptional regulator